MAEYFPLYRQGPDDARRNGELALYRESNNENQRCARAIETAIDEHWDGMHVGSAATGEVITEFGHDRVRWVLAAAMQASDWDRRYSGANREWATGAWIPPGVDTGRFLPLTHPAKLNDFADLARKAYFQLNLFNVTQCDSVFDFETVAGRVLVLKPEMLKDEYKTPESQLFKAERGFGCVPTASGRAIFGEFLIDGEQAKFSRQDFLGVLKPEHMPAWAIEKMAEPEPEQTSKPMHIMVYQINMDRDTEHRCFVPLKSEQAVDPSIYDEVFSGEVDCADLGAVFQMFHNTAPEGYRGREMDTSDVVQVLRCDTELYGKIRWYIAPELFEECNYYNQATFEHALEEAGEVNACIEVERLEGQHVPAAEPGCYYLDTDDFVPVEFDTGQTQVAAEASEQEPDPVHIRVFQINKDRDINGRCFMPLERQAVDPGIYDEVYSGPVPDSDPEAIFQQFNVSPPPLHRGWSMSPSDVIEVGGKHHYVDNFGFEEIQFDASLVQKPADLLRVVVLEPGLPAYEGEIGPDLKSMQRAVGGYIEITAPFDDAAVIVCNEEGKLNGMEGNRRIGGQLFVGPLIIAGDNGDGDLCSLTDAQAETYTEQFAQAEEITMEDVQGSMGMQFYGM